MPTLLTAESSGGLPTGGSTSKWRNVAIHLGDGERVLSARVVVEHEVDGMPAERFRAWTVWNPETDAPADGANGEGLDAPPAAKFTFCVFWVVYLVAVPTGDFREIPHRVWLEADVLAGGNRQWIRVGPVTAPPLPVNPPSNPPTEPKGKLRPFPTGCQVALRHDGVYEPSQRFKLYDIRWAPAEFDAVVTDVQWRYQWRNGQRAAVVLDELSPDDPGGVQLRKGKHLWDRLGPAVFGNLGGTLDLYVAFKIAGEWFHTLQRVCEWDPF